MPEQETTNPSSIPAIGGINQRGDPATLKTEEFSDGHGTWPEATGQASRILGKALLSKSAAPINNFFQFYTLLGYPNALYQFDLTLGIQQYASPGGAINLTAPSLYTDSFGFTISDFGGFGGGTGATGTYKSAGTYDSTDGSGSGKKRKNTTTYSDVAMSTYLVNGTQKRWKVDTSVAYNGDHVITPCGSGALPVCPALTYEEPIVVPRDRYIVDGIGSWSLTSQYYMESQTGVNSSGSPAFYYKHNPIQVSSTGDFAQAVYDFTAVLADKTVTKISALSQVIVSTAVQGVTTTYNEENLLQLTYQDARDVTQPANTQTITVLDGAELPPISFVKTPTTDAQKRITSFTQVQYLRIYRTVLA